MKIGIIGAGNAGSALAHGWASRGHEIVLGSRSPRSASLQNLVAMLGPKARAGAIDEAARGAEVVVLATPWEAARTALATAGRLDDQILVDCTNPLAPDLSGLVIGHSRSAAETIAGWKPEARVVKAFNTVGAGHLGGPSFPAGRPVMFVAGDDSDAKATVMGLAEELGFEAADSGALTSARLLEPLAMLWINQAVRQGWGTDFAFGLLRR